MKEVIALVVDDGEFFEIQPHFAPNLITTFARMGGQTVGILANQPRELAGTLDIEASEKAARFVRMCDAFGLPLVVVVDVPGYLPGVGQEWDGDTRIVLLVVTNGGVDLDDDAHASIKSAIREACSPRHVPAVIVAVPELPRTQTGKLSEIAVREAVHGREVKGRGALANPEVLDVIVGLVPRT